MTPGRRFPRRPGVESHSNRTVRTSVPISGKVVRPSWMWPCMSEHRRSAQRGTGSHGTPFWWDGSRATAPPAPAATAPGRAAPASSPSAHRPMSARRGRECGGPETSERPGVLGAGALTGQRTTPVRHPAPACEAVLVPWGVGSVYCRQVTHGPLGRAGPACPGASPPAAGAPAYPADATTALRVARGDGDARSCRAPGRPHRAPAGVTVTVRSRVPWAFPNTWCGAVREWPAIVEGVLAKSQESEAGSPHVLRGRPAFALVYGTRAAVTGESIARRSCPLAV